MSADVPSFDLTIRNYRCFSEEQPLHIQMRKGATALIGLNNAGKTALLKFFYELRDIFLQLTNANLHLTAMRQDNQFAFQAAASIRDNSELFCNANSHDLTIELTVKKDAGQQKRTTGEPERVVLTLPNGTKSCSLQIFLQGKRLQLDEDAPIQSSDPHLYRVEGRWIDLRSYVRAFDALHKTMYIGPFRNAINVGGKDDYFDIRVGQAFVESWRSLKVGDDRKDLVAARRITDQIAKIFNFTRLEVDASQDSKALQVFLDGNPYLLEELGSGLSQFIVVLGNVARQRPSWLLIDEPESSLHPSLQIEFLTTLASYASEGILFSTHSIGLARACADRIYSVRRDDNGLSQVRDYEATESLSEFLGELSFSGYRELGFDKVLLVEGSTDVKTVQQLLRRYDKDHLIVLLPLGGSDLIKANSEAELQEIKRITTNIEALIDSERHSQGASLSPDRESFRKVCKKVGIPCHVLERRATENYFTDTAVKRIKGDKYRALQHYENLKKAPQSWGKSENWLIAREMELAEFAETDLGIFLNKL